VGAEVAGELKRISKLAIRKHKFTPQLRAWLADHPEGVGVQTPEEAELLLRLLMTPKEGSRSGAFHPSGLTRCKREQMFSFQGVPTPGHSHGSQLQNIFNDGTWRHVRWQLMLMKIDILHEVEVKVEMPQYRLTGSMDGQGTGDDGEEFFFELKGTSRALSAFEMEGPSSEHRIQVNAYLLASGLPEAVMVYENKSNQDWIELSVTPDSESVAFITETLEELNDHVDTGSLPAILPGCRSQHGEQWTKCPYRESCPTAR
jgi:hypothetical protein